MGQRFFRRIRVGMGASALALLGTSARACPECRAAVKAGIFNQDFAGNLLVLVLPLVALLAVGLGIHLLESSGTRPGGGPTDG